MTEIVQKEAPVLRKIAHEVPVENIKSPQIKRIIKAMKEALASQADGVAIAAPQIGEALRIFVISKRIFEFQRDESGVMVKKPNRDEPISEDEQPLEDDLVFINPVMLKKSKKMRYLEEGCLSVRYYYGKVRRAEKAIVRAYDENGNLFERGASGLMAQAFQHEIDHLDGVLFTDKAKDVKEIDPENIQ